MCLLTNDRTAPGSSIKCLCKSNFRCNRSVVRHWSAQPIAVWLSNVDREPSKALGPLTDEIAARVCSVVNVLGYSVTRLQAPVRRGVRRTSDQDVNRLLRNKGMGVCCSRGKNAVVAEKATTHQFTADVQGTAGTTSSQVGSSVPEGHVHAAVVTRYCVDQSISWAE